MNNINLKKNTISGTALYEPLSDKLEVLLFTVHLLFRSNHLFVKDFIWEKPLKLAFSKVSLEKKPTQFYNV